MEKRFESLCGGVSCDLIPNLGYEVKEHHSLAKHELAFELWLLVHLSLSDLSFQVLFS